MIFRALLIVAVWFLVVPAPAFAGEPDGPERDLLELRVGTSGMFDMMFWGEEPAVFSGAGLNAEIAASLRFSPHLGAGARVAMGFFLFEAGLQADWSPGGWAKDGVVFWSSGSVRRSGINCQSRDDCSDTVDTPPAEALGAALEVGAGYRWEFFNDDASLTVGLGAKGAYLSAKPARYSGVYLGGTGPRVALGW